MRIIRTTPGLGVLAFLLVPFLVGFDVPDSAGVFLQVSGGRGTYHHSTCSGNYDSDFLEGNAALRATFAHGRDGAPHRWSRFEPRKATVTVMGNLAREEVVLVNDLRSEGPLPSPAGTTSDGIRYAGGAKLGFDWEWAGLDVGALARSRLDMPLEKDDQDARILPMAGLRVGRENLFASAQICSATPLYSGGGLLMAGVGGRVGASRLWGGVGVIPSKESEAVVKASHDLGPLRLFGAGQVGIEGVGGGSRLGREYGFSVGLETGLPLGR